MDITNPTRRGVLVGAGALAAIGAFAGPTADPAAPDAALLAAVVAFHGFDREQQAMNADARNWSDDKADALGSLWWAALDAVTGLPATTRAGLRAKAAALQIACEAIVPVQIGTTMETCGARGHEMLAYTLAKDIGRFGADAAELAALPEGRRELAHIARRGLA